MQKIVDGLCRLRRHGFAQETRDDGTRFFENRRIGVPIVQAAIGLIGFQQLFQHLANHGIGLLLPEGPHLLRLGGAVGLILLPMDVDLVAIEELAKGRIGIIMHVTALHAEQLLEIPLFNIGEAAHAAPTLRFFPAAAPAFILV